MKQWILAIALVACGLSACRSSTGPVPAQFSVSPADTTVAIGTSFVLRFHVFDGDGHELPRTSYAVALSVTGNSVIRVNADTVTAVQPGSASILIRVSPASAPALQAQVNVLVGTRVTRVSRRR